MALAWFLTPHLLSLSKEIQKAKATRKTEEMAVSIPLQDHDTIERIQLQTHEWNRDNITRTTAYLAFYRRHPAIHWSLLAHLVSRNAGWNMTDLRGDLLPRLLSAQEQSDYFAFLERGNWLIFQDAYPQLLLYEESVKRQTNLFHLLAQLHVSAFMQGAWNHFWKTGDRQLLTICLIINEQHYLEQHVMQDQKYRTSVIETLPFALQELLQLNLILFPCQTEQTTANPLRVYGEGVSHFASLSERIALGKKLYRRLFDHDARLDGILAWAVRQPHTGSRKDYWPHLFHTLDDSAPGQPYTKKIIGCQPKTAGKRLYSPSLRQAWEPLEHVPPNRKDWYRALSPVRPLLLLPKEVEGGDSADMSETHCKNLETIELAVIARGTLFSAHPSRLPRLQRKKLLSPSPFRDTTTKDANNP